jgi:hypothetical protein
MKSASNALKVRALPKPTPPVAVHREPVAAVKCVEALLHARVVLPADVRTDLLTGKRHVPSGACLYSFPDDISTHSLSPLTINS